MKDKLYRVLNEDEDFNVSYNSYADCSSRKSKVKYMYEQIERVCNLSLKCNLKISSALRIASQYGYVKKDIQQRVRNAEQEIPLSLFLVFNDNKTHIQMCPLVDFIVEYNSAYQQTGIYLDEDKGDGQYFWEVIWEMVRKTEFPKAFSRLESCFAFTDIKEASKFAIESRGSEARIARVELQKAKLQNYDMQWVTEVPVESTMKEAIEYARKYWSGEYSEKPIVETLIKGDYIFEKELI